MNRIADLERRRLALLARCEQQRLELTYRVSQLRPAADLSSWTRRASAHSFLNHPTGWIAAAAALLWIARPRRLLTGVGWVTGLLALASRASALLRLVAQLRSTFASLKGARPGTHPVNAERRLGD